jgi:hypothetical protein
VERQLRELRLRSARAAKLSRPRRGPRTHHRADGPADASRGERLRSERGRGRTGRRGGRATDEHQDLATSGATDARRGRSAVRRPARGARPGGAGRAGGAHRLVLDGRQRRRHLVRPVPDPGAARPSVADGAGALVLSASVEPQRRGGVGGRPHGVGGDRQLLRAQSERQPGPGVHGAVRAPADRRPRPARPGRGDGRGTHRPPAPARRTGSRPRGQAAPTSAPARLVDSRAEPASCRRCTAERRSPWTSAASLGGTARPSGSRCQGATTRVLPKAVRARSRGPRSTIPRPGPTAGAPTWTTPCRCAAGTTGGRTTDATT